MIACVLKTGVWKNRFINVSYSVKHVRWLQNMVNKFCGTGHDFVCLTDAEIPGVKTIPLRDNLPGWWSKMELFREFDDCFYIDLDTVLVGDISELLNYNHKFTALRNFSSVVSSNRMGSAIMAWKGNYKFIYDAFMKDQQKHIKEYTTSEKWGDQGFINGQLQGKFDRWQDLFPGCIVSQKTNMKNNVLPQGALIVCFHGTPKPWEVKADWIPELNA